MTLAGQIIFLVGGAGILVGFLSATVMSLDVMRETDTRANSMVSPSAPPSPPMSPLPAPPSPPSDPAGRRLLDQPVGNGKLFSFSDEEEKRVLRQVRESMLGNVKLTKLSGV